MAQTFNAFFSGVAFAATKNMASIINQHATEVIKIRRITLFNSQTAAVTWVVCQIELRKYTSATLTAPTSVTPTSYDSTNTSPISIVTAHAGTIGGTAASLRRIIWSSDEAAVSSATSDELENLPPLNVLYEWQPHSDVQPITLRQNESVIVYNVSWAAGLLDVAIEYTKE